MTDIEDWIQFGEKYGFLCDVAYADHPNFVRITWEAGEGKMKGYTGFGLDVWFDLNGNLTEAGVWE